MIPLLVFPISWSFDSSFYTLHILSSLPFSSFSYLQLPYYPSLNIRPYNWLHIKYYKKISSDTISSDFCYLSNIDLPHPSLPSLYYYLTDSYLSFLFDDINYFIGPSLNFPSKDVIYIKKTNEKDILSIFVSFIKIYKPKKLIYYDLSSDDILFHKLKQYNLETFSFENINILYYFKYYHSYLISYDLDFLTEKFFLNFSSPSLQIYNLSSYFNILPSLDLLVNQHFLIYKNLPSLLKDINKNIIKEGIYKNLYLYEKKDNILIYTEKKLSLSEFSLLDFFPLFILFPNNHKIIITSNGTLQLISTIFSSKITKKSLNLENVKHLYEMTEYKDIKNEILVEYNGKLEYWLEYIKSIKE